MAKVLECIASVQAFVWLRWWKVQWSFALSYWQELILPERGVQAEAGTKTLSMWKATGQASLLSFLDRRQLFCSPGENQHHFVLRPENVRQSLVQKLMIEGEAIPPDSVFIRTPMQLLKFCTITRSLHKNLVYSCVLLYLPNYFENVQIIDLQWRSL